MFPFVGQDDWDETRKTIANDPSNPEWSFQAPEGPMAPSVVVLHADGRVRECGEVENRQGVLCHPCEEMGHNVEAHRHG